MNPMIEPTESVPSASPDFLTLDEATAVLRVGRSTAYREANAFERSGGRTGIPVVRYGKQFRVPRCRLEEQLGGPITWPCRPSPAPWNQRRDRRTESSAWTAQARLAPPPSCRSRSSPEAHAMTALGSTVPMVDRQVPAGGRESSCCA